MKSLFIPLLLVIGMCSTYAGPGDTIIVETIDHQTPGVSWWPYPKQGIYEFPPDTISFSKILMYYTLKCDYSQNPACGEWDYTTHTYLKYHTGEYDSILKYHPNFIVNGSTPDTFQFMDNISWKYQSYFEKYNQTTPSQAVTLGQGSATINLTEGPATDSRHSYLLKADELIAAGFPAGEITGLELNLQSSGGYLKRFIIRMKATDSTQIVPGNISDEGLITVYDRSLTFPQPGWINIPFSYPFIWNGSSNIIVDISYENHDSDIEYVLTGDNTSFNSGIVANQEDSFLDFEGTDYVDIPVSAFSNLDSAITVSFWQYGDPQKQPQNDIIFEAYNSQAKRVLNVHLPWSDGRIYWDAGRDEDGNDRIDRAGTPSDYEGKWNHWAFTKNCETGEMKTYVNGVIWLYASGKYKLMDGISSFRIGGSLADKYFYDGMIDEFRVWNKDLDIEVIKEWMYNELDESHPEYQHLLINYRFDEGGGLTTSEEKSGDTGHLRGYPQWMNFKGRKRMKNFVQQNIRPQMKIEMGSYNPAGLDSTMMVDTIPNGQLMIVKYDNPQDPTTPTDTLSKWATYFNNYLYNSAGQAIDSIFVIPDGVIYREDFPYYEPPYELLINYELGRFITPFGNNLDLGAGWTWIYDVTDFRPFLHDSVHLQAGNFQELLDLKFYMIEGTPPREVKNIKRMWHGYHRLNNFQILVPPDTVSLHPDATTWKLKITSSGHDWDNPTNCAEFCQKTHWVDVNGNEEYTWEILDECADNPLYPQGGTWIYDRAAWCPGAKVTERHLEVTPYVEDTVVILDYSCESDPYGRYLLTSYLFEYGDLNFDLDASVEQILAPNEGELYSRENPMCGRPEIVIKNNGSTTITSLDIDYGPENGVIQSYLWSGELAFDDTAHVTLEPIDWTDWSTGNERFHVEISDPNNSQDENDLNNAMVTNFTLAPEYPNEFIVRFKSNKRPAENYWEIRDYEGELVLLRDTFDPDTEYRDTILLDDGCYTFTMYDSGNDGLSFFAHGYQGTGYLQFRNIDNSMLHRFEGNFGAWISRNFTVGMAVNTDDLEINDFIEVYPNPATDHINISFALLETKDVMISIFDYSGRLLQSKEFYGIDNDNVTLNTSDLKNGIYLCRIHLGSEAILKKVIISR